MLMPIFLLGILLLLCCMKKYIVRTFLYSDLNFVFFD